MVGVLMALIRVMASESDHRKWLRENSNAAELMKHFFGADGLPISVYRVTVGIEETRAVAAHSLRCSPLSRQVDAEMKITVCADLMGTSRGLLDPNTYGPPPTYTVAGVWAASA
jgi:hypothetical protein